MQRYFVKEKKSNYLILEKEDVHHIKNVMRNKTGDLIECIYQEELYICKIEEPSNPNVQILEKKLDNTLLNKFPKNKAK